MIEKSGIYIKNQERKMSRLQHLIHPARHVGESYKKFRKRRAKANAYLKQRLKMRGMFHNVNVRAIHDPKTSTIIGRTPGVTFRYGAV